MGLDYSVKNIRNHQKRQQHSAYRKQLTLAVKLNKTFVIHSREAGNDCFYLSQRRIANRYQYSYTLLHAGMDISVCGSEDS